MISHFDSDHCLNAGKIIEKLKIENLIISKQIEITNEFENIVKLAQENKVNIVQVKAGDKIKIDKNINFEILWPDENLKDGDINNNSIVAKMHYNNFTMLFTGDIEEKTEKLILKKYDASTIKSTVLKVAHHGSKTSTIEELLKVINPKISLIGVGKDNKFGHPNDGIIERLQKYGSRIYRTDLSGEITLRVTKSGKISIETIL